MVMGIKEITNDERYHTCGRCKHGDKSYDDYPCNKCTHGVDNRQDFWELAESLHQIYPNLEE